MLQWTHLNRACLCHGETGGKSSLRDSRDRDLSFTADCYLLLGAYASVTRNKQQVARSHYRY